LGPCGSPTKSVRVRAGPVGSGRARVVEFSLKHTEKRGTDFSFFFECAFLMFDRNW